MMKLKKITIKKHKKSELTLYIYNSDHEIGINKPTVKKNKLNLFKK